MRIREFAIHPELRPFVRSIWQIDIDDAATFGQPWRIVPDGIVELVFNYHKPFALRFGNGQYATLPASFAISQVSTFIEIQPQGHGGFIAVRFEPWGAEQFVSVPVHDFADGLALPKIFGVTKVLKSLHGYLWLATKNNGPHWSNGFFAANCVSTGGRKSSPWYAKSGDERVKFASPSSVNNME